MKPLGLSRSKRIEERHRPGVSESVWTGGFTRALALASALHCVLFLLFFTLSGSAPQVLRRERQFVAVEIEQAETQSAGEASGSSPWGHHPRYASAPHGPRPSLGSVSTHRLSGHLKQTKALSPIKQSFERLEQPLFDAETTDITLRGPLPAMTYDLSGRAAQLKHRCTLDLESRMINGELHRYIVHISIGVNPRTGRICWRRLQETDLPDTVLEGVAELLSSLRFTTYSGRHPERGLLTVTVHVPDPATIFTSI